MINDYEATKPITTDAERIDGAVTNESVIATLNGLIQTLRDGEEGYRTAAGGVNDASLKSLFNELSQERASFCGELQQLVTHLGGDAETETSVRGDVYHAWMDLKSAVTGNDRQAMLNSCERGEDGAKADFKSALEKQLPMEVATIVERQYTKISGRHDQIKALRDSANYNTATGA